MIKYLLYPTLGISDKIFDVYIYIYIYIYTYIFVFARGSMSNTLLRHAMG